MASHLNDHMDQWLPTIECWQCGGSGELANCFEEFACIDPDSGCEECLRRCDICGGKGHWVDPDYLEDGESDQ